MNTGISSIVAANEESDKLTQLRTENEKLKNKLAIAEMDAASAEESFKNEFCWIFFVHLAVFSS